MALASSYQAHRAQLAVAVVVVAMAQLPMVLVALARAVWRCW